jgi:hypothetical protein
MSRVGVRSPAEIARIVAEYGAVAKGNALVPPSAAPAVAPSAPVPPTLSDVAAALLVTAQAWLAALEAGEIPTADEAEDFCADLAKASGIFRAAGDDGSADSLDGFAQGIDLVGLLQENGDEVDLGGLKAFIAEFAGALEGATEEPEPEPVMKDQFVRVRKDEEECLGCSIAEHRAARTGENVRAIKREMRAAGVEVCD